MGNYLKLFENHAQYEEYTANTGNIIPAVSHCIEEEELHYSQHEYSKDYLTFAARTDCTFKFNGNNVSYSLDSGETWADLTSNTDTPTVTAGNKIMWKTENGLTPTSSAGIGTFSSTAKFDVEGNPMSLLYGDDFRSQTSLSGKAFAFKKLFNGCTNVVSAKNMSLLATTLATACYQSMFYNCTSLTAAPTLSATTLVNNCYYEMFYGCTSLTTAPALPATTLANNCYGYMFRGCTSLTTAPELPATTLAEACYSNMFYGCTNLTTTPELPAATLTNFCYDSMFYNCTSLTAAPALPATTLANSCYCYMFQGCTGLTTAPAVLPATTLESNCYNGMFNGCKGLTTAPELPATTLANYCYQNMFYGCTNLKNITCLATNVSATSCTNNWVSRVAASGTFKKAASMTSWATGANGIPTGWTVQDA